jgi:ABC-type uncharacterized transport system permease subunit
LDYFSNVLGLTDKHFFALAVIGYGISLIYSIFLLRRGFRRDTWVNYSILGGAFLLHTAALLMRGFTLARCPVNNLYEAVSFIAWTIVTVYLVFGGWSRLRFLGAFASLVLFAMGVFALMPGMDPPTAGESKFTGGWTSLHAALILLAYGSFGLGSVAGMMYLSQEHDLKYHKLRAVISLLPPIQRLETVVTRLLWAGFILLTAGLCLSPILLKQTYGVYFKPDFKVIWSVLVWVLYLCLLGFHWFSAQRGRRFAWGAVGGFVFVLLTFWGVNLLSPIHNP